MKKIKIKYLIIYGLLVALIILILVCMIFGVKIISNLAGENDYRDIRLYRNLEKVSVYNEYALAVDENGELTTYAVFKNTNHEDYEKVFSLDGVFTQCVEGKKIVWTDSTLYLFGLCSESFDLKTGNNKRLNSNILLDDRKAKIEYLGAEDGFVYYKHILDNKITFKKVDLEFTNVYLINKEEVPSKFIY